MLGSREAKRRTWNASELEWSRDVASLVSLYGSAHNKSFFSFSGGFIFSLPNMNFKNRILAATRSWNGRKIAAKLIQKTFFDLFLL